MTRASVTRAAVANTITPLGRLCAACLLLLVVSACPFRIAAAQDQMRAWNGPQNVRIPRLGRVQFFLPRVSATNFEPKPFGITVKRVRGVVAGTREPIAVSYSINHRTRSGPAREILFNARNPRTTRIAFVRITNRDPLRRAVVSVPATLLSSAKCGTRVAPGANTLPAHDYADAGGNSHSNTHAHAHGHRAGRPASDTNPTARQRAAAISLTTGPTLKVAFVADSLYGKRFGAGTEQHLVTMLDQVNVIYQRDLGITISPVLLARERTATTLLRSSDSGKLLDGFAVLAGRNRYGNANLYHLLTGQNLDDNIIGLANLPGACAPQRSLRVGLSQFLNPAIDYMTIAHEIGHNLAAEHDEETFPSSLMFPSLPVDAVEFSSISKAQIQRFQNFADVNECLNDAVSARSSLGLKAAVDSRGGTSLSLSLPTLNDSCTVVLESSVDAAFSAPNRLVLGSSSALSLKVISSLNRRPDRPRRIFLRATASCGKSATATTTSVSTAKLSRSLPVISARSWAKQYLNSFR